MSEPENFLSRWSRRKLEGEPEKAEAQAPDEPASPAVPAGEAAPQSPHAAKHAKPVEPEFDLTTLPSLESITGETDIRAFLQRGVPAALSRAALRRAWSADPAIRDFKEIAENQYDFATGSDIPGFGSLDASSEDIRKMVAQVFGGTPEVAGTEPEATSAEAGTIDRTVLSGAGEPTPEPPASQDLATNALDPPPPDRAKEEPAASIVHRNKVDVAMQQNSPNTEDQLLPNRRPHGRALPQ